MLAEISSITTALVAAKDLGSALLNERDRQKAATIQIDLTDKIVQAQMQLAQVLGTIIEKDGRIQTLAERVRELEAQNTEKGRYRLAKLGVVGDCFAYQLRPATELDERVDEPTHFLCQPCFDAGKKGILQVGKIVAICPLCKTKTQIAYDPSVARINSTAFPSRDW